jgi:hypothetical protein
MILLVGCLFFCAPVHHARPHHVVTKPQISCEQLTKGHELWDHQDDWVSQFPAEQQRRVLQCLSKLKK